MPAHQRERQQGELLIRATDELLSIKKAIEKTPQKQSNPIANLTLPKASYSCLHEYCAEQVTYPPEMLYWVNDGNIKGWLCENCWEENDWNENEIPTKGISLKEEMIRQQSLLQKSVNP